MNRILLETSAYSAFRRGNPSALEIVQLAEEIALTPIVLGELWSGFSRGSHRSRNESELRRFLDSPRVLVVPLVEETGRRYSTIVTGLLARGRPIPTNDIWIAASAMEHGLRIVTSDAHFLEIPQVVVEPLGTN